MCNPSNSQVLSKSEHSVRKEPKKEETLHPDKAERNSGARHDADFERLAWYRDTIIASEGCSSIHYPDGYGTKS